MSERTHRFLSDRQVALAAVGGWVVAVAPGRPSPATSVVVGAVAVAVVQLVARRAGRVPGPGMVVVIVLLGVAVHTSVTVEALRGAVDGLASVGRVDDEVVLVTDPEQDPGRTTVLAELEGTRLRLEATGGAGRALAPMLAGERTRVIGRVHPVGADEPWLTDRHVVGHVQVDDVRGWVPAGPTTATANRFRALLARGAVSLDDAERALLAGLLVGDDRALPPEDADAFTAAGLTHLTAVSGQNVAFVLAVLAPLLRRLPGRWRPVVAVVALGAFALVTRAEPSVLRAVVMAGLAATAHGTGRITTGLRNLGLAVTGLLLVDPLLARRPGFILSVVASLGILLLAAPLAERLPGPRPLREALGVTVGAQVATAPLLAMLFGTVPLGSLPANVLAGPAAGAVMVYGLVAGTVAGLAAAAGQGRVAAVLHLPTQWLLGWLQGVAAWFARWDPGVLGLGAASLLAAVTVVGVLARRRPPPRPRPLVGLAFGGLVVALVGQAVAVPMLPGEARLDRTLGPGAALWRADGAPTGRAGVLVLDGRVAVAPLLEGLREERVRSVQVVIVRSDAPRLREVVAVLRRRVGVEQVLAPGAVGIEGAGPALGSAFRLAGLRVAIDDTDLPWSVTVSADGG